MLLNCIRDIVGLDDALWAGEAPTERSEAIGEISVEISMNSEAGQSRLGEIPMPYIVLELLYAMEEIVWSVRCFEARRVRSLMSLIRLVLATSSVGSSEEGSMNDDIDDTASSEDTTTDCLARLRTINCELFQIAKRSELTQCSEFMDLLSGKSLLRLSVTRFWEADDHSSCKIRSREGKRIPNVEFELQLKMGTPLGSSGSERGMVL